jgi:hypothetical protein
MRLASATPTFDGSNPLSPGRELYLNRFVASRAQFSPDGPDAPSLVGCRMPTFRQARQDSLSS